MSPDSPDAVAEIAALVTARRELIHDKNAGALLAQSASDVVTYDALPPLAYTGTDALRTKISAWFAGYTGPIGFAIRDLQVTAGADVGFAHYLYHVTGTLRDGSPVAMWVRATLGLVQRNGSWEVAHEHTSVPFDAETGQAALTLQP